MLINAYFDESVCFDVTWREPRRYTAEMYASAVIAFTHLYTYDLDLLLVTLKTFWALPTHVVTICTKFHYNVSTLSVESISRVPYTHTCVFHVFTYTVFHTKYLLTDNGRTDGRTDRRPEYTTPPPPIVDGRDVKINSDLEKRNIDRFPCWHICSRLIQ